MGEPLCELSPVDAAALCATPVGFTRIALGLPLYDWQANALNPLERIGLGERLKVAVCTPNSAGKSAVIIAAVALFILIAFPRSTVVITSADSKQLDNQIWPAILAHRAKFGAWTWRAREIDTPTGGRLRSFTTDEAGRAEGWHQGLLADGSPDPDAPLVIIGDEAKTIAQPIFQALDRCSYSLLMLTSSPGIMFGRFYDAMSTLPGWIRIRAGLADCPHIAKSRIDDIISTYGIENPFTRSTLYGEFMPSDGDSVFAFKYPELQRSKASPPQALHGLRSAFIDFGEGTAETVVAIRDGNVIEFADIFREADPILTAARCVATLRREKIEAHCAAGDNGGPGYEAIRAMHRIGYQIQPINNGVASEMEAYTSLCSEWWHETAKDVRENRIVLPLADELLFGQLVARKTVFNSKGLIGIEPKPDMAKRGLKSPDRADAVIGAARWRPLAHQVAWRRSLAFPDRACSSTGGGSGRGSRRTHPPTGARSTSAALPSRSPKPAA